MSMEAVFSGISTCSFVATALSKVSRSHCRKVASSSCSSIASRSATSAAVASPFLIFCMSVMICFMSFRYKKQEVGKKRGEGQVTELLTKEKKSLLQVSAQEECAQNWYCGLVRSNVGT